jgi:hypothetical protein
MTKDRNLEEEELLIIIITIWLTMAAIIGSFNMLQNSFLEVLAQRIPPDHIQAADEIFQRCIPG